MIPSTKPPRPISHKMPGPRMLIRQASTPQPPELNRPRLLLISPVGRPRPCRGRHPPTPSCDPLLGGDVAAPHNRGRSLIVDPHPDVSDVFCHLILTIPALVRMPMNQECGEYDEGEQLEEFALPVLRVLAPNECMNWALPTRRLLHRAVALHRAHVGTGSRADRSTTG